MADMPPPLPSFAATPLEPVDPLIAALAGPAVVAPIDPAATDDRADSVVAPPPLRPSSAVAVSAESAADAVAMPIDDVLITIDHDKLPPAVAALVDPLGQIPPGVQFFEKRITPRDMVVAGLWAAGLGFLGLICIVFGAIEIIHPTGPVTVSSGANWWPLAFGFTCGIAAWVMGASIPTQFRARAAQLAGQQTRIGIFVTDNLLIEGTESAFTLIPRPAFVSIEGRTLRYTLKGQPKSLRLPGEIVGNTPEAAAHAVMQWASLPVA
ncbi:MAG: hypothetical protein JWM57_856 [Phycisphaerales bacterium]|nr:hypothetical protein [Phycisphaerales bacterium]